MSTDKRYFTIVVAMVDFQLMAQDMGMHVPDEVQCVSRPDPLWVEKHETLHFPIMEKAPLAMRYVGERMMGVKRIPDYNVWLIWSRAPKLWHDGAQLATGDPFDAHKLLHEWGNFTLRRRSLLRTRAKIEEVWPQWLEGEDWFQGKPDPTCLT